MRLDRYIRLLSVDKRGLSTNSLLTVTVHFTNTDCVGLARFRTLDFVNLRKLREEDLTRAAELGLIHLEHN